MKTQGIKKASLVEGSVGRTLVRLTIPMMFGVIGMVIFNLVDTFFVGRLGTDELAALSFTFPVVLVINSIALGIGLGASALISRAIGEGDHHKVQRLTTDSLLLALLLVLIFVVVGLSTIKPIFRLLGATPVILPLIEQYMSIWYLGMIFVVVPMVGNNAIRAGGDMKTPAAIMLTAAMVNGVLDPMLIFGIGPFPRMEIAGAALATVCARATVMVVSLYVLWHRDRMITLERPSPRELWNSWKKILYIGIPSAGTRMVIPLAMGVITSLVATFGTTAVAGYGVATRIEFFSMTALRALSSVLAPFVGQNIGARKIDRVKLAVKLSDRFSLISGVAIFALLAVFAKPIARIFNADPDVISTTALYLRIVPIGYGVHGILMLAAAVLNVLNKPIHAAILMIIQMFALYVPLAYLGSHLFDLTGLFIGISASLFIAGMLAHFVLKRNLTLPNEPDISL